MVSYLGTMVINLKHFLDVMTPCLCDIQLRNEFHFSGFHGAMNRSGSRAK